MDLVTRAARRMTEMRVRVGRATAERLTCHQRTVGGYLDVSESDSPVALRARAYLKIGVGESVEQSKHGMAVQLATFGKRLQRLNCSMSLDVCQGDFMVTHQLQVRLLPSGMSPKEAEIGLIRQ